MKKKPNISRVIMFNAIMALLALTLAACSKSSPIPTPTSKPTPTITTSPGGTLVVQIDSIVSARIEAIHQVTDGYQWVFNVLIERSQSVDDLVNPTKDKVGQVVTMLADRELTLFRTGQEITARVKYTGDAPKPGIFLYIYDIRAN